MTKRGATSRALGLRAYLKREGFWFGLSEGATLRRLRVKMGDERHERLIDALDSVRYGGAPIATVYQALGSRYEANGLFSLQSELTLAAFEDCVSEAGDMLRQPGARVADLGCLTGATTRWLAATRPHLVVVGIDREAHLLAEAAKDAPPNCTFLACDYADLDDRHGGFDLLLCAVGIGVDRERRPSEDQLWSADPSEDASARDLRAALVGPLRGWTRVSRVGAVAACAIRVATPACLWAIIGAAADAGWIVETSSLHRVDAGPDNLITAWRMLRVESPPAPMPSFEALLANFVERRPVGSIEAPDADALLRFLRLSGRKPLARSSRRFDDGHWMRCEAGTHSGGGYILWSATTGFRTLRIVSRDEAEEAGRALAVTWLQPPLTERG